MLRRINNILLIAALSFWTPLLVQAQQNNDEPTTVSATVSANYGSRYFAPIGFALEEDNSVMQGAVVIGVENVVTAGDGLDAFWWGNEGFNGGPSEMDWGLGYSIPIPSGAIRVGYDHYRYPDGQLGTPEDLLRFTLSQSRFADVVFDAFWRVTEGLNKEAFINLTLSKTFSTSLDELNEVAVTPRVSSIYNENLWGLTGYAGTMFGTKLELQRGSVTAFADVMQFVKSGDHFLEEREIKNHTILQIGMSADLRIKN